MRGGEVGGGGGGEGRGQQELLFEVEPSAPYCEKPRSPGGRGSTCDPDISGSIGGRRPPTLALLFTTMLFCTGAT